MREIKLRALAKDGIWRYGYYPCLNVDMGNTTYPLDTFWQYFLSSFKRETLGEYTGLKDKNGVEIYDGDICHRTNPSHQIQKKSLYGKVIYSYGGFGLELIRKEQWEGYTDGLEPLPWTSFCSISLTQIEVIGNIYENPEVVSCDH